MVCHKDAWSSRRNGEIAYWKIDVDILVDCDLALSISPIHSNPVDNYIR